MHRLIQNRVHQKVPSHVHLQLPSSTQRYLRCVLIGAFTTIASASTIKHLPSSSHAVLTQLTPLTDADPLPRSTDRSHAPLARLPTPLPRSTDAPLQPVSCSTEAAPTHPPRAPVPLHEQRRRRRPAVAPPPIPGPPTGFTPSSRSRRHRPAT